MSAKTNSQKGNECDYSKVVDGGGFARTIKAICDYRRQLCIFFCIAMLYSCVRSVTMIKTVNVRIVLYCIVLLGCVVLCVIVK